MKTLLLTFDYPPMIGGIANALGTLWERSGCHESVVLAPAGKGAGELDGAGRSTTVRFPVVAGNGVASKLINLSSGLAWFTYCAIRFRPQLVIAGQIRRAGPIARLWSIVTRRPYYLWVYGGETSPDFTRSARATAYLQRVLRGARVVFTISPYTTRLMSDFGIPGSRIVEVPLGTRHDVGPRPKDRGYTDKLGLHGKLVFLTVGRLVERKGVDTMLRALAEIDAELPAWRYLVVSDGPYRVALEELASRLGIADRVTFTGYVDDAELATYYNLSDVFCMPNREVVTQGGSSLSVEGFGMVFVDAAACGKPVIGGRSGGAVDAISHGVNGFLVAPGDVEDLKRAIVRLADAGVRATMGKAGLELASRFDWSRSASVLRPYLSGEKRPGFDGDARSRLGDEDQQRFGGEEERG